MLMSHTPGWNMSIRSIAKANGTGVDTIKSAIKELEEHGYLTRSEEQSHSSDGTFADYVWTTCDPFQNPVTVKPRHGETAHKEEHLFKEEQLEKKNIKTIKESPISYKGSRFSPDAEITDSMLVFAQTETPYLDPYKVFEEFKDYWIGVAGSRGVKLDWEATWRNWCRKQSKPRTNVSFKEQRHNEARDAFLRSVSQQRELGE